MATSTPQSDDADKPAAGRLIASRYRLHRVLGKGAMGVVWLGYDEVLYREVAVKEVRLPPGMPAAEADSVRERTLREARAIAALTHPNVIAIYDVARQNGDPFVVMELVAARSLAELIRKHGSCTVEQAAVVADALADALQAAHRRGITHRDVKPGNVLVGDDGQIKLTDFGIARNVSELTMTHTGMVLGTPAYIAPEVAAGDPVTPAADLWSLGGTLFAAVEGHPPYEADEDDPVAMITEVVHGDAPRPRPDAPLADIISGLMVKEPSERIDLAEVRRRVHTLLPEPGVNVFPTDTTEQSDPADNRPTHVVASPDEPLSEDTPVVEDSVPLQPPPLTADPGPLPFVVRRSVRRRGVFARLALIALAVLVFGIAAAGGFAAARRLGGRTLLPPKDLRSPASSVAPISTLSGRRGDVYTVPAKKGGTFSVDVPDGWTQFLEQRVNNPLPVSAATHYVSQYGDQELTVERFPDYYPHTLKEYVSHLQAMWPDQGAFFMLPGSPVPNLPGNEGSSNEPATELTYRTVDPTYGTDSNQDDPGGARRTTYAVLYPYNDELWVLSLTVPTKDEGSQMTTTFNVIDRSFQVTG